MNSEKQRIAALIALALIIIPITAAVIITENGWWLFALVIVPTIMNTAKY